MMKPTTRNLTIPQEIIIEIFSWLPVTSLMRFRCVSRFFNSLVSESDFVDIHQCRSMTREGATKLLVRKSEGFYIMEQREDGKATRWNFDNLHYDHVMYADGLFCIWNQNVESVRICNPSTREVIRLPYLRKPPSSIEPLYNYSLGYEPEEKKYKVLMTCDASLGPTRNWMFTLGIDESWREIESSFMVEFIPLFNGRVCIEGVIYMLDCKDNFIAAFDVKTENFRIIKLWDDLSAIANWNFNLIQVKGELAFVYITPFGEEDLCFLRNSPKDEWERHVIVLIEEVEDNYTSGGICNSCDGEIVFVVIKSGYFTFYFYDVGKNSWRKLKTNEHPYEGCIKDVYSYTENLFPLGKFGVLGNDFVSLEEE